MNRSRAVLSSVLFLLGAEPVHASFHFMKIEQVIGGVGDPNSQAIQLRMRFAGQNLVGAVASRLIVRDAAGQNPVTLIVFPSDVANGAQGDRILVVSGSFGISQPHIPPDFHMTNVIPPAYLAAGRLTFEDGAGTVYWSLAWGGTGYSGPNNGVLNDDNGDFGPPFGGALPSSTNRALRFTTPDAAGAAASTSNAGDYAVTAGPAVLTNNAGQSGTVLPPPTDLSITKTDGRSVASPGQVLTYTIVAANAGPYAAPEATVDDLVPPALIGTTWTCLGSGGGTCSANGTGSINDSVSLPGGASVTYTLTGTVAPNPNHMRNQASVDTAGLDPNDSNNVATDEDLLLCFGEQVIVPDGRLTENTIAAGATAWFGAQLEVGGGTSYSLELKSLIGNEPPGTLTVFAGADGCTGTSTLDVRDTTGIGPESGSSSRRVSFFSTNTLGSFFRARLVNGSGNVIPLSVSWSETTMYSPAWSTNGRFDTYYSFMNTTDATLSGRLLLMSVSIDLVIPAAQTLSVNTASLGVARNQTGSARFTHDGPPGAILAEAAVANFTLNPAYVQPVKFHAVREAR